jgi:hypothetical protein
MKLKNLVIALSLALFPVLALPVITPADSSGTTQITGNIAAVIDSISPASGVQGNSYSGVIIRGTDLTGASSVGFGPDITTNSFVVNSDTQITASISLSSIAAVGARDFSVVVSGVTAIKTLGFTVIASSFSITAPSAISLGSMIKGETAKAHSTTAGSVSTNSANWSVVAKDSSAAGTKGRMLKSGPTALQTQLRIGNSLSTCSTNAGDSVGLVYTQGGGASIPLYVEQDVASDDAIGAYSITIAFTGSTP